MADNGNSAKGFDFKKFATPRIIGGIAIALIVLWALSIIFSSSVKRTSPSVAQHPETSHTPVATAPADRAVQSTGVTPAIPDPSSPSSAGPPKPKSDHGKAPGMTVHRSQQTDRGSLQATASDHQTAERGGTARKPAAAPADHAAPAATSKTGTTGHTKPATTPEQPASDHGAPAGRTATAEATGDRHPLPAEAPARVHKPTPKGVAFVEAAIKPLDYELEERWWGWRPNDIINLTDNVNHFQLGVLEVTRRTIVALAERISRHGVTDALDPNLEEAMNWFMVKASSYWFPSAESKYRDALDEMRIYLENLKVGKATFYIRSDNLIPLLASFEDLLGSCDENLVKEVNDDGTPVSFSAADNYFFYTQGVASAMAAVLEAVHHDFLLTLESRNATELLHHAIVSCQRAAEMDPWIILDRNLSSIFANHRANMAAPISHARFYLGQLVKTLST